MALLFSFLDAANHFCRATRRTTGSSRLRVGRLFAPCTHDAPRRSNAPRTTALVSPYRLGRGRWDPARQRSALSRHGRPPQALGARTRSDASGESHHDGVGRHHPRTLAPRSGGSGTGSASSSPQTPRALSDNSAALRRSAGWPARSRDQRGREVSCEPGRPAKRRQRPDLAVNHGERARRRSAARAHGARRVSSVARAHSGAGPGRVACRLCATRRPLCRSWCS